MDMALLCTNPRTCLTAYAVVAVRDGHNFVAEVVSVFILSFKRLLDQFEDVPAANLITPAATDTFFNINGFNEFWRPGSAAPRVSDYLLHIVLPFI
jgi:hypothetical protein